MIRRLLPTLALLMPGVAGAQAYQCTLPQVPQPVHAELPSDREPRRVLPIGGYTLAVTWAPEYCFAHRGSGRGGDDLECGGGNSFGFTLHGLWPDGIGPTWPQYCKSAALLPQATIRRHLCATPSAQLMQHEWAKHGTCTGDTADAYFARSTGLYARLRFPDMAALAQDRQVTAGRLAAAIARMNPGLAPDMMRVTDNKKGWLDEIWFCLDKRYAFARCRANSGGVLPDTPLRIARPRA